MINIQSIASFSPTKENTFLFDTNILIKIFYPALGAKNSAPYINMYQNILSAKSALLISSIQISEFVNRCIRFQFDIYKSSHPEIENFKDSYRSTDDYCNYMNAILEIIENDILPHFNRINDNFESMNTSNLFKYGFSYDFNDAFIAEVSRLQNTFLIIDDSDYINFLNDLDIITNNKKILMFQSHR